MNKHKTTEFTVLFREVNNLSTPGVDPVVIDENFNNDNSCASLPDGRIASFWLERPGGPSVHELRVMSKNGEHVSVLQLNIDFWDFLITAGSYY